MEDNKSYFYSLFSEEESSSPEQYLLDLWDTNKQQVLNIIENTITHSKKYRGLSKCVCSVAIKIRDERLSSIIERKASSCIKSIESNSYYVVASILLSSKKIIAKFCKNFNGSFSNGFDHYDYNDFITSFYLEIIALTKCREAKQYVSDLLNMADTQISRQKYIRKHQRYNSQEKILIPDKILKKDCNAVKMGEAVFDYLNEGAEKLKMYLNSTGDRADRASFYLWCLACNKNKNDIVYFVDHLNNTDNFHIKNICLEASIHISDNRTACNIILEQLNAIDFNKAKKKKGGDFKLFIINKQPLLKSILECCFYLDGITDELANKISILSEAKDKKIADLANALLCKFKGNKPGTDTKDTLEFISSVASPAGLLSLNSGII